MKKLVFWVLLWPCTLWATEETLLVKLETLASSVDQTACRDYQEIGACSIGEIPGRIVLYKEPALIVATQTSQSGGFQSLGALVSFHDVFIYDFPKKTPATDEVRLCPGVPIATLRPRYSSINDAFKWRDSAKEEDSIRTGMWKKYKFNDWGYLMPANGFVVHPVPIASSALAMLRAIHISGLAYLGDHKVILPLEYGINPMLDQIQLLSEKRSDCLGLVVSSRVLERFNQSKDGDYVWVYWRNRTCCKPIFMP